MEKVKPAVANNGKQDQCREKERRTSISLRHFQHQILSFHSAYSSRCQIQSNPDQLMLLKVERTGHRPPPPHNNITMIVLHPQTKTNNNMKRLENLCLQGSIDYNPEGIPSTDFGAIFSAKSLAVISPSTTDDIAAAVKEATNSRSLTIAARGNGHSTHGQAMAAGGILLDMRSTALRRIEVGGNGATIYADAGGGALWRDVLRSCVMEGRVAPRSWTDYLGLTVGGTLSNAGISGQCFRYGPQTSNVAELEVVTGRGDVVVCSENKNSDLFFSVLGGLGQFGVITRARILLHPAPDMVRWSRMVYSEFENFSRDAEFLICRGDNESCCCLDYVEGFAFVVGDGDGESSSVPLRPDQMFDSSHFPLGVGSVAYCLEVALNYCVDDDPSEIAQVMEGMIGGLSYCKGLRFEADVSYVEFLLRVEGEEEEANKSLSMAHPWLNLLVSRKDMVEFDRLVLKPMLKVGVGGPVLIYPLLRNKWDERASTVVPEEDVFYLVALLRSCERGEKAEVMLEENEKVVGLCKEKGMDFKVYIPHYKKEEDWRVHFGEKWEGFVEKKTIFDPVGVLAPGQNIFARHHSFSDDDDDDVLLSLKTVGVSLVEPSFRVRFDG